MAKITSVYQMFKDGSLQALYEEQGYVKIPFLNKEEVAFLTKKHEELMTTKKESFHTSLISENVHVKIKINEVVSQIFAPKLHSIFINVKPVIASFLTKEKGVTGKVDAHQDWTFVDETKFRSLHIWCPLIATNSKNGNLEVLPRSHKLPCIPRCSPLSYAPYKDVDCVAFVEKNLKAEPTQVGEAIIYDSSLIHFSPPNFTNVKRIAASMLVIPEQAEALLFFAKNDTTATAYKIDTKFLIEYTASSIPNESERIGDVSFNLIVNPLKELKKLGAEKNEFTFWQKMKNVLQ